MEQLLRQLVERLRKAHGEDLISVILYGSAAEPTQHDADFSDINILCVLRQVTPAELTQSEPVFAWWRTFEKPVPLLLSASEVHASADCFCLEFRDMQRQRRVLTGVDVIEDLQVEDTFYRARVEYELRTKLLRLRQKAGAVLGDRKLLGRLLMESVTTFSVLIRHALLLLGGEVPDDRRAVLEMARDRFGIDPSPFLKLLDVREKKIKADRLQPFALLGDYLKQIEIVVDAVDRRGKSAAAVTRGEI